MDKRTFLWVIAFSTMAVADSAVAQNAGAVFNMFTSMMRAAAVEQAGVEWSKLSLNQTSCMEQTLQRQRYSIRQLIQNGISPHDPRVGPILADCSSPEVVPTKPSAVPALSPPVMKSQVNLRVSGYETKYMVHAVNLGSRIDLQGDEYRRWFCEPSEQYPGFTRCSWEVNKDHSASLMHSAEGVAFYLNGYVEPATWKRDEPTKEIERLSQRFGERPKQIIKKPHQQGIPDGTIAIWGDIKLKPLAEVSRTVVAEGRSAGEGILVDFIGRFSQSAKKGPSDL